MEKKVGWEVLSSGFSRISILCSLMREEKGAGYEKKCCLYKTQKIGEAHLFVFYGRR